MVAFEEALNTVLTQDFGSPGCERVGLSDCAGRILAEDIFSDMDMPPFDKSAVDGYACRIVDVNWSPVMPADAVVINSETINSGLPHFASLRVIETIAAGSIPKKTILPFECSKIMTGAMVPEGAGCVVMVEDMEMHGDNLVRQTVELSSKNICYRGEDIRAGDLVLGKGVTITPAHVAVLASVGATNPLVAKLPRVGIISTGDELVEPMVLPGPAQIRNSNGWQLAAQVMSVPAVSANLGIAPDNGPALRTIIDQALLENDVVLLTGGVSMGEFDHVPEIMLEAGVEILFKKIAIQPGKPTVFGRKGNKFIFGLPGNPVSSYVLFEVLVRPFLRRMMGCMDNPLELTMSAGVDFSRRRSDRKSLIPVIIRGGNVFPVDYHGSAHINAFTKANAIMIMEVGTQEINKEEEVHVRPL